jgi:hypothetical protein
MSEDVDWIHLAQVRFYCEHNGKISVSIRGEELLD